MKPLERKFVRSFLFNVLGTNWGPTDNSQVNKFNDCVQV